jgi:hypothetical protein
MEQFDPQLLFKLCQAIAGHGRREAKVAACRSDVEPLRCGDKKAKGVSVHNPYYIEKRNYETKYALFLLILMVIFSLLKPHTGAGK